MRFPVMLFAFCLIIANESLMMAQTTKPRNPIGLEFGAEMHTRYLWRGMDLNHKYGVFQPSVVYSPPFLKGLSAGIWGSYGLAKKKSLGDRRSDFDEVDWTLNYNYDLIKEKINMQLSVRRYDYLSRWASRQRTNNRDYEIGGVLNVFLHEYAVPYFQYYRGLDEGMRGYYFEFGIGGVYQFTKDIHIGPSLAAAMGNQFGQKDQLTHIQLLVPLSYTIEKVEAIPTINALWRFRRTGTDPYNQKGIILAIGIMLGYRF